MFGLDIGNNSIKIIQLEKRTDNFALIAAGMTNVVGGGITGTDNDLKVIADTIKNLTSDAKISTKEVSISLPESQTFTRLIKLPYLSDAEVASAISWQAEVYIPIPIKEASLSHVIIERHEPKAQDPGGVDVLLVASPKSLVQRYLKVAEMAGLEVVNVETELLALARSLSPAGATTLIIDLGAISTDMAIIKNKQLISSRSIATAGNTLTRAISTAFSVNQEQAETYKRTYGFDTNQLEGKLKEALAPVFNLIIEEIKKSIQYYKTEINREDMISFVLVTGGGSGLPGIVPYLTENLGMEVGIGDPFANIIKDPASAQTLASYGHLYSVAVGLAQKI